MEINYVDDNGVRRKYYPPPAYIKSYLEYEDINKDPELQLRVTNFFVRKIIKWINTDKSFKHLKQHKDEILSDDGYELVHKILKKFVKDFNIKWYELRENYKVVKDYFKFRLVKN